LLGTWSAGMVNVIDHRHVGNPYGQRRVGSKADIELAPVDVRFTPTADICSAIVHVRFVPKADICTAAINRQQMPMIFAKSSRGLTTAGPSASGDDVADETLRLLSDPHDEA
jgi:hypothetical protein